MLIWPKKWSIIKHKQFVFIYDLLKIYNTIWDKVSADIKKGFDSEDVYKKEFLKTKIKFHGDKVTDLTVIGLDSALKEDYNYYP